MIRNLIILCVFLLLTRASVGQSAWRVDQLDVADGLSQGYIYAIHQDKKGFIWIGTHGGLNRYDGHSFRVFQYKPFNAATLSDNAVFFITEDSTTGKFWIGGSSALNEFDPEKFTTTRYRHTKKHTEFSDGIFINQHELLLACENNVMIFDTQRRTFSEIPVYDDNGNPISITRAENTAGDKEGHFMIMSRTGIFFYDPVSKTCKRKIAGGPDFSMFNDYEVFNVLHDKKGNYWIATNKKGLIRFDPVTLNSTTIALPPSIKKETTRFDVVLEDSRGNIWAGSSNGLYKVDPNTLKSEHFSSDHTDGTSLSHNEINAICEDKNHIMWVGTVGAGINKMIPRNIGFKNFSLFEKNTTGIRTGTYVMAIQQMGEDIWFTNIWDQIGKINMKTQKADVLTTPLLPADYGWYSEGTILKNKENELSVLNGDYEYRITRGPTGHISVEAHHAPGIYYVHHTRNGKSIPFVKEPVEQMFQRNDTIFGNQFFFDAKEDNAGNIWIGSSKGLIKYDQQKNVFTHYRHDDSNVNSVSSEFIYALEFDERNETVWMAAYNGGLCSYSIPSGTFRHYSQEDGLSDNTVYSLEKDDHGNLWFSSNAGISAYNIDSKTFRNYSVSDGLLNNEFNRRSSFKNEEGWMFFGGVLGIDYFHPDSIIKNNSAPILAFTRFTILNQDYIPRQQNTLPLIDVAPDQRYLTVEFASLNYYDQQKIQYAYRLNDGEWIATGNSHIISFSDLSIGLQHLRVRSTNSEGLWLNNEIECLINIHPWWWQTWWFRIVASGLVIGILLFGTRVYYQRKLEKHKIVLERRQAVEKERTRIATDMHDDLGANLSRIKFLSETIDIKTQKQENIDKEIGSIRRYAHEMIDKMGEIVWALNEKNDSLNDLLAYTRAYAVDYLSQNGIQSQVQVYESTMDCFVSGEFRRNVFLTVKEALHNVVKHSQASRVDIRVETGRQLTITIHDNGKGFDETNMRPFSNGIINMKKRMNSVGGHLQISNTDGSCVILFIPLPLT